MSLAPKVRSNLIASFPSVVVGQAPVTVGKQNGVWSLGLSAATLAIQNAVGASDYLLTWDASVGQWVIIPLSSIIGLTRLQRSTTVSPVVVGANDMIINVNLAGAGTCTVPLSSTRNGIPITFKMLPGSANLVLSRSGSNTFDGMTTLTLVAAQTLTLMPYNDGVNTGYAIE